MKTTTEELGVDEKIASFVLPLGMTINMNGTAIMQVVATLFIAGCAGYDVTLSQLIVIALLALIASAGTPAAPGAGAIILFTHPFRSWLHQRRCTLSIQPDSCDQPPDRDVSNGA